MNDSNIILFFDLTSGKKKLGPQGNWKKKKNSCLSPHSIKWPKISEASKNIISSNRALQLRSHNLICPPSSKETSFVLSVVEVEASYFHWSFETSFMTWFIQHSLFIDHFAQIIFLISILFFNNYFFSFLFFLVIFFSTFFFLLDTFFISFSFFLFLFSFKFSEIFSSHFFFQLFFSLFHFEVQRWRDFYCIIMQAYTK